MNEWLLATVILVAALVPCGLVCALRSATDGLVALELAGVIDTTALVLLSEGFHRQPFVDLAVVAAMVTFAGSLVFARILERWL